MVALLTDAPTLPAAFSIAGFDDVLVFSHSDDGFALIGGSGRGVGWAGIVDLEPADDSLVGRAWQAGTPTRQASARARHVAGPYHARHAVAVPVGERYVVVFGSHRPIRLPDPQIVRAAVDAVDTFTACPPTSSSPTNSSSSTQFDY